MNKQEAIEKLESRAFDIEDTDLVVGLRFAQNTVKQIDEPKKAVVPRYIDTWIQGAEYNGFDLYEAMTDETPDKVSTWIVCNPETFAKAWLYGYEVEKEKLYTVEIPNPHGLGHTVLVKDMYGNIFITHTMNSDWRKSKVNQLTEAEIKKDFDWAWQFAKRWKND